MKKLILLAAMLCFTGCGSSSPRFGASIAREKKARTKTAAVRPLSREAKEEAAEDDVKVDPAPILKRVKASSRAGTPTTKQSKAQARAARKKSVVAHPAANGLPPEDEPVDDAPSRTEPLTAVAVADTAAPVDQQKMMETIAEWLETPYSYGSDGNEEGIDCSAFTREVFEQAVSITLPRSSGEQAQVGERVARTELKFGDLVFFKTRGRSISHVGIYLGDHLFAHASSGSGVTISSLDSTYFNKRYAAARRVLK